jgi:hypothetical protein
MWETRGLEITYSTPARLFLVDIYSVIINYVSIEFSKIAYYYNPD